MSDKGTAETISDEQLQELIDECSGPAGNPGYVGDTYPDEVTSALRELLSLRWENERLTRELAEATTDKKNLWKWNEALERDLERLRGALETIAAQDDGIPTSTTRSNCMARLARAALAGKE